MAHPEMVINLWYVVEKHQGLVYALAGKVYALYGSDEEKLALLRRLAATDYWTAKFVPVPERFHVVAPNAQMAGATTVSVVNAHMESVFSEVLASFGDMLIGPIRIVNGEVKLRRLRLPQEPLCVLTALVDDGTADLRAQV